MVVRMKLSEGTISIVFGCHSLFHSFLVLISWIKLYQRFPKWKELVCIFIHDIGHIGKDYLSDYEQKKEHWKLGAKIALFLFGDKGFNLVAGHDASSGYERSKLYKADKYSFYIMPFWWPYIQCIFEPKLYEGQKMSIQINDFKKRVKESIESGEFSPTHNFYLDRYKRKDK